MRTTPFFRQLPAALAAALLLATLSAPLGAAAADGPQPLPPGQVAPEFAAIDLDGKPFSLKEALAGGPAALVFWSLLCGSCREELPLLQQELPQFEANKVRLYAMNLDQASHRNAVKKFVAQQGFTFTVLLNEDGEKSFAVEDVFQVKMTPALFLIGADGKILYSHYGPLEPSQIGPEVLSTLPKN